MKRVWPILAVADVAASAAWYKSLLCADQTHPGSSVFDQIVDSDGTVLLCLHCWGPSGPKGDHHWATLATPSGESDRNGLLLWFVVDDFDAAWQRPKELAKAVKEEPNTNNGTGVRAFVIEDLDGYHIAVNEGAPKVS